MLKDSRPIRNTQRRERVREEVVRELVDGPTVDTIDQTAEPVSKTEKKV